MLFWILIGAAVAVPYLCWNLYRRFGSDRIAELSAKRRPTSRMVSGGEFFDGNRRLEVALALTADTFYYENADMEGSLDLRWIQEIEYDTRLATGAATDGGKVLRLRCHSQTFEFLLPDDTVVRWHMMLPARRAMANASEPQASGPAVPQAASAL